MTCVASMGVEDEGSLPGAEADPGWRANLWSKLGNAKLRNEIALAKRAMVCTAWLNILGNRWIQNPEEHADKD